MFSSPSPRYSNPKPKPKPKSKLKQQLLSLVDSNRPLFLKIILIQSLISNIKHKSLSLKIKNKLKVDPKVQEKMLWKELERLEEQIIEKRREKEEMEDMIDMHCNQLEEIEEILEVKEEIKYKIDHEIYQRTRIYTEYQSQKILSNANDQTEPTVNNQSFCI